MCTFERELQYESTVREENLFIKDVFKLTLSHLIHLAEGIITDSVWYVVGSSFQAIAQFKQFVLGQYTEDRLC